MNTIPKVGDHVRVPWGIDILDGLILEISRTGNASRAVVEVDFPKVEDSEEGPMLVTLPLSALRPADWWPDDFSPAGGWASAASYERHVIAAIKRVSSDLSGVRISQGGMIGKQNHRSYDCALLSNQGNVVIEIKYLHRSSSLRIREVISNIKKIDYREIGSLKHITLVVNINIPKQIEERMLIAEGPLVRIATWRSPKDDILLSRAIGLSD